MTSTLLSAITSQRHVERSTTMARDLKSTADMDQQQSFYGRTSREALAAVKRKQRAEGVGADQRPVAAEDERVGVRGALLEIRLRHHHRVAGAELLLLERELDVLDAGEFRTHELRAVADHEHDLGRARRTRGVHHPVHHRAPHHGVHHLREVGLHARALAGGEDHGDEAAVRTGRMVVHLDAFASRRTSADARSLNWPAWIRTKTKWTKTTCATITPRAKRSFQSGVTSTTSFVAADFGADASGTCAVLCCTGRGLSTTLATVAGARGRVRQQRCKKPVRGQSSKAGAPARPHWCSMRGLRLAQSSTAHLGRVEQGSGSAHFDQPLGRVR